MMDLSLIVAYRNRPGHLHSLLNWFPEAVRRTAAALELIIVESSMAPSLDQASLPPGMKYHHEQAEGPFNKSRLLNYGLALAKGEFVTSLDVDLFPYDLSFKTHLALARLSEKILIAGYRMTTSWTAFSVHDLADVQRTAGVAREHVDKNFLQDQLQHQHRFGHTPVFLKKYMDALNGWDEHYVGWGAEDQDMIHRYLGDDRFLLISPDVVYLHLEHGSASDWNDNELTRKNREYLYKKLNLTPNIQ